jgi:hypothetical protein
MKRIDSYLGAAAAALTLGGASAEAFECTNGYAELGNSVIVLCGPSSASQSIASFGTTPQATFEEEPLYTGSIEAADTADEGFVSPEPDAAASSLSADDADLTGENPREGSLAAEEPASDSMMAEGPMECRPGQYWIAEWEDAEVLLACPAT